MNSKKNVCAGTIYYILGVAQLCNKMDGLYFDVSDEEIATAFSIYCGISIVHSIVYKKMQDAQARNKLSNEVMMYHMKVNILWINILRLNIVMITMLLQLRA